MGSVAQLHNENPYSPFVQSFNQIHTSSNPEDADIFDRNLSSKITSLQIHPSSGEGHFCDLFTGLHPTEGTVALKRPRISPHDQDSVAVRRFLREAKTWGGLVHPNILRFLGTCKIDGFIFLVSPYMRNGTVMDFIKKHPDKADRIALIREIGAALEYLHAQNIIHGDLKGANVLVSDEEHALLCDFGLARMEHTSTSVTMKRAGTLRWQAPELWEDHPKTFKSDVYALAMTITEILSGGIPFRQYTSRHAVMRAVLDRKERPPKEPIASSDGISYEWLWGVATMCWHKNPHERPLMPTVTWLLDCQPAAIPPMVPANHPTLPLSMVVQHPRPFVGPQDTFGRLPPAVLSNIFCQFSLQELVTGSHVCRLWNFRINTDPEVWATKLREAGLWRGGGSEATWAARYFKLQADSKPGSSIGQNRSHPYKGIFRLWSSTQNRWMSNNPKEMRMHLARIGDPLRLFRGCIVTAFSDGTISLHSAFDPKGPQLLKGHNGTVSALDFCSRRRRIPLLPANNPNDGRYRENHHHDVLVSASWDRTIRMWDMQTGKNTHTFTTHQNWVWCVAVVKPTWVEVEGGSGVKETWPKHHMLVSGDGVGTIVIWRVPGPNNPEYHGAEQERNTSENPYYVRMLKGHNGGISSVAVHGRTIASGSMDATVRIWDLVTGVCKHTLVGHPHGVDSVALDPARKRVFAASWPRGGVRIWSLENGSPLGVWVCPTPDLTGEISLSANTLVAGSVDGTLISWDLSHIGSPACTFRNAGLHATNGHHPCFRHDDDKIIHGYGKELKIWNTRDGTLVHQMVTDGYIQSVAFDYRFCVAVTTKSWSTDHLHIWDFSGDLKTNENREPGSIDGGDLYDEDALEDVGFSDSEGEGEGTE